MMKLTVAITTSRVAVLALSVVELSGCGQTVSPSHGTPGTVLFNGGPLADIQVNVFSPTGERIAFGVSDSQGAFQLVTPDAKDAVVLKPGTYQVAVESVGSVPVPLIEPVMQPTKSPLNRDWSESDQSLQVDLSNAVKGR